MSKSSLDELLEWEEQREIDAWIARLKNVKPKKKRDPAAKWAAIAKGVLGNSPGGMSKTADSIPPAPISERDIREALIPLQAELDRLAPGSEHSTRKAWEIASQGRKFEQIVEFGCGTGAATLLLAKWSGATITAIDTCGTFLSRLHARAQEANLVPRIRPLCVSMDDPFLPGTKFDLIWCEGAVHDMGLDAALSWWRTLLPPGGRIVVNDLVWTDDVPSRQIREFWESKGLTLRHRDESERNFAFRGYRLIDQFLQPIADWQEYYHPFIKRMIMFEGEYHHRPTARKISDDFKNKDAQMFHDFKHQYGYVFYIAET